MLVNSIMSRRSIRRYKDNTPVSNEELESLLKAAMYAPSACNSRPWKFVVIKNRDKLNMLSNIHPYAKMLSAASLAIIVCALPDSQQGIARGFYPQDCAAATQNILIQATSIGLGSCWIGVYPNEEMYKQIQEIFSLPNNIIPFNVIAIGSPDEKPDARGFYDKDRVIYVE